MGAAGPTSWHVLQPKATLLVSETQLVARSRNTRFIAQSTSSTGSARSRLIEKHKQRREKSRDARRPRSKFTTIQAAADETLRVYTAKGSQMRRVPRGAPHY